MSAPTKCEKCGAKGTFAIQTPCVMKCGGLMYYDHGAVDRASPACEPMEQRLREVKDAGGSHIGYAVDRVPAPRAGEAPSVVPDELAMRDYLASQIEPLLTLAFGNMDMDSLCEMADHFARLLAPRVLAFRRVPDWITSQKAPPGPPASADEVVAQFERDVIEPETHAPLPADDAAMLNVFAVWLRGRAGEAAPGPGDDPIPTGGGEIRAVCPVCKHDFQAATYTPAGAVGRGVHALDATQTFADNRGVIGALEQIHALGHDIHGDLSTDGCAACIAKTTLAALRSLRGPDEPDPRLAALEKIVTTMRRKEPDDYLLSEIQDYLTIAGYDVPLRSYRDGARVPPMPTMRWNFCPFCGKRLDRTHGWADCPMHGDVQAFCGASPPGGPYQVRRVGPPSHTGAFSWGVIRDPEATFTAIAATESDAGRVRDALNRVARKKSSPAQFREPREDT